MYQMKQGLLFKTNVWMFNWWMAGYYHQSDVTEALALTNKRERCLVLTDIEGEVRSCWKRCGLLGQAVSLMYVRNDDRTNDQKRIIWQIVQTRWMWARKNQFLIGWKRGKNNTSGLEISLINLLHLSLSRTNNWACQAGRWDKKLEGGGGEQLVCTY